MYGEIYGDIIHSAGKVIDFFVTVGFTYSRFYMQFFTGFTVGFTYSNP